MRVSPRRVACLVLVAGEDAAAPRPRHHAARQWRAGRRTRRARRRSGRARRRRRRGRRAGSLAWREGRRRGRRQRRRAGREGRRRRGRRRCLAGRIGRRQRRRRGGEAGREGRRRRWGGSGQPDVSHLYLALADGVKGGRRHGLLDGEPLQDAARAAARSGKDLVFVSSAPLQPEALLLAGGLARVPGDVAGEGGPSAASRLDVNAGPAGATRRRDKRGEGHRRHRACSEEVCWHAHSR